MMFLRSGASFTLWVSRCTFKYSMICQRCVFRQFGAYHAILRRAPEFPWNVSATKLMANVGISRHAGVEQKPSLGERLRAQSEIYGIEVARANPECLVAACQQDSAIDKSSAPTRCAGKDQPPRFPPADAACIAAWPRADRSCPNPFTNAIFSGLNPMVL